MSTRWYQERRREGYYRRAKEEGFRARSAYKLQQIDERFRVFRKGSAVADLGCAPGGWTQVLLGTVNPGGVVVGVDLQRTRPLPGAFFVRGDFTQKDTQDRVVAGLRSTGRLAFDAVVSDMAPDMSGNYATDQARSVHLCEQALAFAEAYLRPGGNFVCKVFEGQDFAEFRETLRKRFARVRQFRPEASRRKSSEVYLVGLGFQGEGPADAAPAKGLPSDSEE